MELLLAAEDMLAVRFWRRFIDVVRVRGGRRVVLESMKYISQ